MVRDEVVASCLTETAPTRCLTRRALLGCMSLGLGGLWTSALLSRGVVAGNQDAASAGRAEGDGTGGVEVIRIALTPELRAVMERVGADLRRERPRLRLSLRVEEAPLCFRTMTEGNVTGVLSPRRMLDAEARALAARGWCAFTVFVRYPQSGGDPLFLYLRGDAYTWQPALQALARRWCALPVTPPRVPRATPLR